MINILKKRLTQKDCEGGFILEGSPETGWILIMSEFDYFAKWLGEDLGAMWVYTDQTSDCLIIRKGEPTDCTLQEFSILLCYYPAKRIEELKIIKE